MILRHAGSPEVLNRCCSLPQLSDGIRVWDVSAGEKHTLLLADGDCIQPIIYYSGQQVKEEEEEVHTKELNRQEEGQEEDEGQHWAGGGYTRQPVLLPFCMNVRTSVCGWVAELCHYSNRDGF